MPSEGVRTAASTWLARRARFVCVATTLMHTVHMKLRIGTSGFSYKEWRGAFFPETLLAKNMLAFYAEHFHAVEINNTFYRMPKLPILQGWAQTVPEDFVFALKASRRITHRGRFKEVGDDVLEFWNAAAALGPHLGPILFQFPPYLEQNLEWFNRFLTKLPNGLRAAFEFRNQSWFNDATYTSLQEAGHALCLSETDDGDSPPRFSTASWGYIRLRREIYSDDALHRWVEFIHAQSWNEVFVFFKHEDEGRAPRRARRMTDLCVSG